MKSHHEQLKEIARLEQQADRALRGAIWGSAFAVLGALLGLIAAVLRFMGY